MSLSPVVRGGRPNMQGRDVGGCRKGEDDSWRRLWRLAGDSADTVQ